MQFEYARNIKLFFKFFFFFYEIMLKRKGFKSTSVNNIHKDGKRHGSYVGAIPIDKMAIDRVKRRCALA